YAAFGKSLAARLYETHRLTMYRCEALKLTSRPGESEGDFRARLALAAREQRDTQKEALQRKYATKLEAARNRVERAEDRAEREKSQASQQKVDAAISVGQTVLGALFGRKLFSTRSVGSATTAARKASRIGRESEQADRALESREQVQQRYADLEKELADEIAALDQGYDAQKASLSPVPVAPRKSDIAVAGVRLLWTPWRNGSDGFPQSAA
ncbi:MAG: hypothetical protein RL030_2607, partial [Pseudomonadota bacterium]